MTNNLHFFVSLQRAGKTTIANKWKVEGKNRVLVGGDEIRLAIYNRRFSLCGEPAVHMVKQYMLRTLLAEGYNVLYDDTNTSRTSIDFLFEINESAKYTIIDCDPIQCQQRAFLTNQLDLIPVIERCYPQYLQTIEYLRTNFPKQELSVEELMNV
jgi:hypothetical protein